MAPLVQERTKLLTEVAPQVRFLFGEPVRDEASWAKVMKPDAAVALTEGAAVLADLDEWTTVAIAAVSARPITIAIQWPYQVSATMASINRGDYCISKAGIAMATKLWATRLAEFGIQVYEVRPGIVRTDMTSGVTEKYDKLIAEGLTVEPRWGLPEDVGRAVAVLARGELSYATGNVILVDGGMTVPRL